MGRRAHFLPFADISEADGTPLGDLYRLDRAWRKAALR